MTAANPLVQYEKRDGVGLLTLNRPDAMNALSRALREELETTLRQCLADKALRALVITGNGKAFCAGNDLKELASGSEGDNVAESGKTGLPALFAAFEIPLIAAVNGFAITAGFELALACDLIIAAESARFADTHARVGVLPGWGLSQRLPRLIGMARAKELSFSGNQLDAAQALQWGLVNHVVPDGELVDYCLQLAADMASCVPHIVREYKQLIDRGYDMPLAEAIAWEAQIGIESASQLSANELSTRHTNVIARGQEQKNRN